MEGIKLANQEGIRMHGEKENCKYLGLLEAIHKTNGFERKNKKRIILMNGEASRNQALQ